MAIGPYATATQVRARYEGSIDADDDVLELILDAVSRRVELWCQRVFYVVGASASARIFRAGACDVVRVDDFHSASGVTVKTDDDGDGTFETTWSSSDYQLEPLNGVWNGQPGWPYWQIRAVDGLTFPTGGGRARVQVTAPWGWSATPDNIREATILQTQRLFKRGDSPLGVAGFPDMGAVMRLLAKLDPDVEFMLKPYRKSVAAVGR